MQECVRCFRQPGAMRAGFEDYRATPTTDLAHDGADRDRKVAVPTLVLWGETGRSPQVADMKLSYEEADRLAPRGIPLGRIAEVKEVANLVAHLASPLAHFVNGSMIEIDGGQQKPLMDAARSGRPNG